MLVDFNEFPAFPVFTMPLLGGIREKGELWREMDVEQSSLKSSSVKFRPMLRNQR